MIKKLKRKKQRLLLLLCMIVVGTNPLANLILIHFAATMLAAVRRSKWFSEISNLHRVRGLIFVNWAESSPTFFKTKAPFGDQDGGYKARRQEKREQEAWWPEKR